MGKDRTKKSVIRPMFNERSHTTMYFLIATIILYLVKARRWSLRPTIFSYWHRDNLLLRLAQFGLTGRNSLRYLIACICVIALLVKLTEYWVTKSNNVEWHQTLLPRPRYIGGRGVVFDRFLCLYLSFFVSLLARLRENGWTELHEIFREGTCGVTMGRPDSILGQFGETAQCRAMRNTGTGFVVL